MLSLIDKVETIKLKDYCNSFNAVKFSPSGATLEGKFGTISFDFSDMTFVTDCHIKIRRKSGNGLLCVTNDIESKNYTVLSKSGDVICVKAGSSKQLSISRPASGIGDIEIVSVILFTDHYTVKHDPEEIRKELRKAIYTGIKQVGDKFIAVEGGKISGSSGISVQTSPPNMFKIDGSTIKFLGNCEILSLSIDDFIKSPTNKIYKAISQTNLTNSITQAEPAVIEITKESPFAAFGRRKAKKAVDLNVFNELFEYIKPEIKNESDQISLCSIHDLKNTNNVWIKEFVYISNDQIELLKKYKNVLSPCISNVKFMKEKGVNSSYCEFNYPYIPGQKKYTTFVANIDGDYDLLTDSCIDNIQKLYNAHSLIFIAQNTHYHEPIIDVALSMGIHVYSNNLRFISENGFNYIKSIDEFNKIENYNADNKYNESYDKINNFINYVTSI